MDAESKNTSDESDEEEIEELLSRIRERRKLVKYADRDNSEEEEYSTD